MSKMGVDMKRSIKKRCGALLFILLVTVQPTWTVGSGISDWLISLDKAAEQKYWQINSTFLGNFVLSQIERYAPLVIGLGIVAIFIAKMTPKKEVSSIHKIEPVIVTDTTLKDYAGTIPAAVLTLIDQIKNKEAYKKINAPVTKGVLLTGLPGTGKSFLARAVAGEVGCPFFATTTAEFSDPYFGVSEAKVRNLFAQARFAGEQHPSKIAIIFIDEIDAIGGRQANFVGGAPIAILQTLLTEMDGFGKNEGVDVVVLAATNTPQNLDPALRRKGRFDHIIEVKNPDKDGRRAIAVLYLKKYPHDENINPDSLAQLTSGMSPADMNALFAEAARHAALGKKDVVGIADFCYALLDAKKDDLENFDDIINIFVVMYPCDKNISKSDIRMLFADPKMFMNIAIIFEKAYKKSQEEGRSTISKSDLVKFVK